MKKDWNKCEKCKKAAEIESASPKDKLNYKCTETGRAVDGKKERKCIRFGAKEESNENRTTEKTV